MLNESAAFHDGIHIEQLEVFSVIGVLEHERKGLQRLTVSISFWPPKAAGHMADDIAQAVNYSAVAEETKRFAREQTVNLIETLARRLARPLVEKIRNAKNQRRTAQVRAARREIRFRNCNAQRVG